MPSLEATQVQEAPLVLCAFAVEGRSLRARAPLPFAVSFNPADGLLTAEGAFNIHAVGGSRAELEAEVADALRFLWREYVDCPTDDFSADALALRNDLLRQFSGVGDADGAAGGGIRPGA